LNTDLADQSDVTGGSLIDCYQSDFTRHYPLDLADPRSKKYCQFRFLTVHPKNNAYFWGQGSIYRERVRIYLSEMRMDMEKMRMLLKKMRIKMKKMRIYLGKMRIYFK